MRPEGFNMHAALRDRFRAPEYAILFEVRNATGFSERVTRSADALVMSLYPSRGLNIIGIECKASRGDWLNELRNPDKSVEIQKYCDQWYLAVEDKEIVRAGELPATWGLLVPRGKKLVLEKESEIQKAEPITRGFLASIMRNAHKHCADEAAIKAAVAIERRKWEEAEREIRESNRNSHQRQFTELQAAVMEFEKASGIQIRNGWRHATIGTAVRHILDGGMKKDREELQRMARQAEGISTHIKAVLEESAIT